MAINLAQGLLKRNSDGGRFNQLLPATSGSNMLPCIVRTIQQSMYIYPPIFTAIVTQSAHSDSNIPMSTRAMKPRQEMQDKVPGHSPLCRVKFISIT